MNEYIAEKKLLLVDGSSYLYRAFHALPDLRNRFGEPTGALFGVLNMLAPLIADYKPDYAACVFDAPGPTFRHHWYAEYKAQRPPMPAELVSQIAPLHRAIEALGWPLLCRSGVEADDVIGTLTRQASARGWHTVISSGDKDLVQLLGPGVTLVNTLSNQTLDWDGATQKYGISPDQFVDYLTLIGDTADNVPGVPKVGPKTAAKWLQQYGSLDHLVERAAEIKGAVGDQLRASLAWLPEARRLVTLDCQVAELDPERLRPQPIDWVRLAPLAERHGLKRWQAPAPPVAVADNPEPVQPAPPVGPIPTHYITLLTPSDLDDWLTHIEGAPLTALDTETTGLDPLNSRLVGLSFCTEPGVAAYLPLGHQGLDHTIQLPQEATLERLRPWLENPHRPKVGQNLKFDRHIFANHGIDLQGVAHDTLLQSYLLEAHLPHDLESLARRHLGRDTLSYQSVTGKGAAAIGFEQVAIDQATAYAAEDADVTLAVHRVLYPQLQAMPALHALYQNLELPLQALLWRMERQGVLLNRDRLVAQSHELGVQLQSLEDRAHRLVGHPFNLNSSKQIQAILFDELKLPVLKKTPGGQPSTDEEVLQQLALDYPLPKLLLDYRGLAKLKSTYTDVLPRRIDARTGRVHTHYAQAVAVTGRLSSNDPNLQNIPVRTPEGRRIRSAFVAPPGCILLSADYSQIELRIMAHLSQDPALLSAFALGLDVHRATAAEIFGIEPAAVTSDQRRTAKAINFGLIYGMSAFGLARQLNLERQAAQAYIDRYFERYPGVARYMNETRETARRQGYVETLFGRRLGFPDLVQGSHARRQAAERAAINAPLQGTAADLIKRAMLAVQSWIDQQALATRMILQVHDELVLEVPLTERDAVHTTLPGLMTGVATLAVPLLVEVGEGPDWESAH